MLARAFSSFVEDSARAKGYSSDFLSYGSDTRLLLFGKPFPEGEERKALNKAFGDFFKEVQKEVLRNKQETGEIKFSVRAAAKEQQDGGTKYQAAYHGSQHVFDTFSVEHIGTGEGQQAHGWGLYFAADENVAEAYRDSLTSYRVQKISIDGETFSAHDSDPDGRTFVDGSGEILSPGESHGINVLIRNNFDIENLLKSPGASISGGNDFRHYFIAR